ncbi:MAG: class I SAM-dependent methyltransferase [Planctomycetota bacterium]|jgi:2-polyprenyl-3-methyl-5-hydroxy-6-metoxy-1,4-benzoquinol methylase
MFEELEKINARPEPFEFYTAPDLWTDEHTSNQMLMFHLNENVDLASRNAEFIDRSVQWITAHFNITADTKIADFGCGPGLYTTKLAQHGAIVTGIDLSENSINYAKKIAAEKGLKINYVLANYLDFQTTSRFDLITMIFCDLCALSPEQRKKILLKFNSLLKPDGYVLLDVLSLNSFDQKEESAIYELNQLNGFWSPNKYYGFLNTFKYEKEKVICDKYTIIEAARSRTVYNWLQYFAPDTLEREFAECGFAIEHFYSDVAGSPFDSGSKELAVVARKL